MITSKDITQGEWYAIEYGGYWAIQTENYYTDKNDLLNEEYCPQAKANAEAIANLPNLLKENEKLRFHLKTLISQMKEDGYEDFNNVQEAEKALL